ncbi:MAG: helix-turn-helix transcriptional regulator [Opitutae bacterium]|nr:helix-turn-helix transcriptional regulator [Opitutae bacterium]
MTALKCLQLNLRRLRTERGLTQQEMAERAALDYKYYQRIETGAWPGLQLRTVDKLAKALHVEVADLFVR